MIELKSEGSQLTKSESTDSVLPLSEQQLLDPATDLQPPSHRGRQEKSQHVLYKIGLMV